jgi:hypothetical protein
LVPVANKPEHKSFTAIRGNDPRRSTPISDGATVTSSGK